MSSAADYIENLQVNGRLAFTTEDIVQALGKSVPAIRAQLRRSRRRGASRTHSGGSTLSFRPSTGGSAACRQTSSSRS